MTVQGSQTAVAHILLIDACLTSMRSVIESFRAQGYRLSVAQDGHQGYQRAIALQPDVILSDIKLPRMDGLGMLRMLKACSTTARIPVLFMSSSSRFEDCLTSLQEGAVDYVRKPVAAQELLERVRVHLRLARLSHNPTQTVADNPSAEVSRTDTPAAQEPLPDKQDTMWVVVRAAQKFIRDNLDKNIRAKDLAQVLCVPELRVRNAFQQCLNTSVFNYVRDAKMDKAKYLLGKTGLSVEAIAHEVGYSNSANFSTAFSGVLAQTPTAYRTALHRQGRGTCAA